MFSVVITH